MISTDYIITAAEGMHARPATAFVRLVKNFKSTVSLKKGDKIVKLNSLLNILSLMIKGGDTISIIVEGDDEADAAAAIDLFFKEQLKGL
jgi:phosphocarrier protein HPr